MTIKLKLNIIYLLQQFMMGISGACAILNVMEWNSGLRFFMDVFHVFLVGVGAALATMITATTTDTENYKIRGKAAMYGCAMIIGAQPLRYFVVTYIN